MNSKTKDRFCIVNADDFGASTGINRGVLEAYRNGILTSCSLMVNMPGTVEAIGLAREWTNLSVGLHVNFTNEGDPVIDISDNQSAKKELYRQYHWFVNHTGYRPTHLDSHHNVHRNSNLNALFVELAQQQHLFLREHSPVRYYSKFYGQWDGESHPEHVSTAQLVHVLKTEIKTGFTELACHPGYITDDFHSEYSYEREIELRTLCDPVIRQALTDENIRLVSYSELSQLLGPIPGSVAPV